MEKTVVYSSCTRLLFLVIALLFFSFNGEGKTVISDIDRLFSKKLNLTQQLDSLDLQKQNLKRNGLSIDEIEQQQSAILDSLTVVRNTIRKASETSLKTPTEKAGKKSIFSNVTKPDNLFDWVILIVGTIALFSGLLLVTGILRLVIYRYRSKRTKKSLQKSILPEEINKFPPTPAFPVYTEEKQTVYGRTSVDLRSINNVQNTTLHSIDTSRPDTITTSEMSVSQHSWGRGGLESDLPASDAGAGIPTVMVKEQVLAAAREGLDIATISKKFHLSSDLVALIIKLAGNINA